MFTKKGHEFKKGKNTGINRHSVRMPEGATSVHCGHGLTVFKFKALTLQHSLAGLVAGIKGSMCVQR